MVKVKKNDIDGDSSILSDDLEDDQQVTASLSVAMERRSTIMSPMHRQTLSVSSMRKLGSPRKSTFTIKQL